METSLGLLSKRLSFDMLSWRDKFRVFAELFWELVVIKLSFVRKHCLDRGRL